MKNKPWFIYVLKEPENGEVRYVGYTINLHQRFLDHFKPSRFLHGTRRDRWLKRLMILGRKPILEILEIGEGLDWANAERKWIKHFRMVGARLTNHTNGGEGIPGRRHSKETRRKQRESITEIWSCRSADERKKIGLKISRALLAQHEMLSRRANGNCQKARKRDPGYPRRAVMQFWVKLSSDPEARKEFIERRRQAIIVSWAKRKEARRIS
jgi:hypothetical protein